MNINKGNIVAYILLCILPALGLFIGLLVGRLVPELKATHNPPGWCTIRPPGGQVVATKGCNIMCYRALFLVDFQQTAQDPWTKRAVLQQFNGDYSAALLFVESHPANTTFVCYLEETGDATFSAPTVNTGTIVLFALLGVLPLVAALVYVAISVYADAERKRNGILVVPGVF